MRAHVLALSFALASLAIASPAYAYKLNGAKQLNGKLRFRINTTNFTNKVSTNSNPSADDYEAWIRWAVGQWRERSGANVEATYDGRTSLSACHLSADNSKSSIPVAERDGINTIDASSECMRDTNGRPHCGTAARVLYHIENGIIKEVDMCVFPLAAGEAYSISVTGTNMNTGKDLVSTLVHEAGHMYGLGHSDVTGTVMMPYNSPMLRWRFPTYDDIRGLHSMYGARPSVSAWGSLDDANDSLVGFPLVGGHATLSATLGPASANAWRVAASGIAFDAAGDGQLALSSASYPLAANSSWTTLPLGISDYPIAIAAATTAPQWLGVGVARPVPVTNVYPSGTTRDLDKSCPQAMALLSTNGFQSLSQFGFIPNVCAQHRPTLAYDPKTLRWVLVYTDFKTQKLFVTTTANGVAWTSPQDLGIYAFGGASAACDRTGACMLAFPSAMTMSGSNAVIGFYVVADGSIAFATSLANAGNRQFHVPLVAVRGWGNTSEWYYGWTQHVQPENARHGVLVTGQVGLNTPNYYLLYTTSLISGMPAVAANALTGRSYWFQSSN